jgi:hypothetical protein
MGALTMTIDERDPSRLQLRGDASGSGLQAILDAALGLLAASPSQLIVDVGAVTAAGSPLVRLLNDIGRQAAELRRTVILEVPDDSAEWLKKATLSPALRVEPTHLMEVRAESSRPAPSRVDEAADGTARREGRGFVASYGAGRRCAAIECSTTLSRYNSDPLCWLHSPNVGSRRT